jgi:hypothetical protein
MNRGSDPMLSELPLAATGFPTESVTEVIVPGRLYVTCVVST